VVPIWITGSGYKALGACFALFDSYTEVTKAPDGQRKTLPGA
jgi:hypothetical protein